MRGAKMGNKSIGLCLSGGGHRASIFTLGALLYLVDADRHRDVKAISSVSGGSLTSGFFAAQTESIQSMDREAFDRCAARWAGQIAGNPSWWITALATHVVLFVLWAVLTCMTWGWLPPLSDVTGNPRWWESQLGYLLAVCVWAGLVAHRPGGTFWGWWGTWLYVGIFLPAAFLAVFVWWAPLPWLSRIAIAVVAAGVIGLRPYIADYAFRATVFGNKQLKFIQATPHHVFCATEIQEGRHVFFGRNFIHSYTAGLGQSADLRLSTAVQASANFPVAFPYRIFRISKYRFKLRTGPLSLIAKPMTSLALSDGGVQDNMGITWFVDNAERIASLKQRFSWDSSRPPKSDCDRIEDQLVAMDDRSDLLIVVNSSFPPPWTALIGWVQRIPLIGEIVALLSVQRVMYNHRGREQSRQLHRSFFDRSRSGALVSIEHSSQLFFNFFLLSDQSYMVDPLLREIGLSDIPHSLVQQYRQRAQAVQNRRTYGPDHQAKLAKAVARSHELLNRLEQLSIKKAQAIPRSAEEEGLGDEIAKCKAELAENSLSNEKAAADQRIRDENTRANEGTLVSLEVPTTLRPLGISATSALLRHGYLNCMNICHLLHEGFPLFDDAPSPEEMQKLALGSTRDRYPDSFALSAPFGSD